ncbi:CorA family divalent cation transporter [Methyloraptor flagellatus]|uniref:CorA family divalent cation transporter n=1 Tax=Methyloraptor flagellatus TaxID=3162530 RepID=A0AAU7XC50_9HYPH
MSADDLPIPGLIWAYHFPAHAAPRLLPAETVTPNELPADGFLWLHFSLTDARLPVYLPNLALLPADGCRALLARDRHLSLSVTPHAIVGVMPDFRRLELDESAVEYDRFRFLATDRLLVTARTHPLRAMATVRSEIDAGRRFAGPADLFGALSETFELTIGDIVQGYNDEIDTIEEQIFTERRADLRARVGTLRRGLIQVHRTLRTTARLFHRLDAVLPAELGPATRTMFEQRGHHFAALDQDVVSLQERARLLHEEIDTRQQQETNRHLYILSIATSLLLPPTLVTGYFGMNTKDLPLQDIPDGALWATGLMLASAAAAALALWRVGVGRR